MPLIDVKNRSKVPFVLNLRHGLEVGDHPDCQPATFKQEFPAELPTGEVGTKAVEKTLPASLTWQPGETKHGLPDALLKIEEFRTARTQRVLVVQIRPA